jgi:hypothetical protein
VTIRFQYYDSEGWSQEKRGYWCITLNGRHVLSFPEASIVFNSEEDLVTLSVANLSKALPPTYYLNPLALWLGEAFKDAFIGSGLEVKQDPENPGQYIACWENTARPPEPNYLHYATQLA